MNISKALKQIAESIGLELRNLSGRDMGGASKVDVVVLAGMGL